MESINPKTDSTAHYGRRNSVPGFIEMCLLVKQACYQSYFLLFALGCRATMKHHLTSVPIFLQIVITVLTGGIIPSEGRYMHRTTQTSKPTVEFERTIPVFEQTNIFRALTFWRLNVF
jgi:hypothetical protein